MKCLFHASSQHSAYLAGLLKENGLIDRFYSGAVLSQKQVEEYVPRFLQAFFANRLINTSDETFLRSYLVNEVLFQGLNKLGFENAFLIKSSIFQRQILKDLKKASLLIGFDTSSWLVQKKIPINMPFVLDQTTPSAKLKKEYTQQIEVFNKGKKPVFFPYESEEVLRADVIVTASTFTKQSILNYYPIEEEKVIVNPYPMDLSFWENKAVKPDDCLNFFYTGNITSNKGLGLLHTAWKKFEDNTTVKLNLIGNGDVKLIKLFSEFKNVKYWGRLSKTAIKQLYRRQGVFIFPTYYDGFGFALAEAMASGLAVISTANCVSSDIIKNGQEGFIFPAGDKQKLREYIDFFIKNKDTVFRYGSDAQEAVKVFTKEQYLSKWQSVLEKFNSLS